jgi:two-component system sensor histidine kinase KdpD
VVEQRAVEGWIARVRLGALAFAFLQVVLLRDDFPNRRYELAAWGATAVLAVGAPCFFWLSRRPLSSRALGWVGFAALTFDTAVVSAFVLAYSFELGTPVSQALIIPLAEAALRYGLRGGIALPFVLAPVYAGFEWLRSGQLDYAFDVDHVTFSVGVSLIAGLFIGWLVERLRRQSDLADGRAQEAEALRDELGRRADILDATNRCARALSSSLEIEQAFSAFIRELRGLVPFDRTAILLAEGGHLRVFATAGAAAETVFPPGTILPLARSVMVDVLESGQALYREDMTEERYAEEAEFAALGLRSRVLAPLLAGTGTIGAISLVRREPAAFSSHEIELLSLLGRLAGTAVQNIRAYEAERTTAEELRRLSALRADFVSLVSHELRSPMSSVIGSAQTLKLRWRELTPDQRESFLGLIAHETSRLAELISDVLDTSRIEAGTFSYSFADVDLAELVRDSAAMAERTQDEVLVNAVVREPLPQVRGDRDRLRQVLINLIDNAVKYSNPGDEVRVEAQSSNGRVVIEVHDQGPGIAPEHQRVIFEKFGRIQTAQAAKPGTGLGLFIARSIAEAHGGLLSVRSHPEQSGATFTLSLPG